MLLTEEQGLNLVGRNVRILRRQLRFSRPEVVLERANHRISDTTLARLEQGRPVRLGAIVVIAEALGVTPGSFFEPKSGEFGNLSDCDEAGGADRV